MYGTVKPKEQNKGDKPKLQYYQTETQDIFSIRGTDDVEDLLMDANLVLQDSLREIIQNPAIEEKEKQLIKYIRQNRRQDKELVLTAHSLGSYHINNMHSKLPSARVVGFGHVGFNISPKAEALYSYDKDPLYRPTGKPNHIVLKKNAPSFFHNPFNYYHSTKNFY